ncbi:MAG: hypothetical protein Q9203_006716 [Teloschistes exilis]
MRSLLFAFILLLWQQTASQTISSSHSVPTPTCLQPRSPTDPTPSAISSFLSSAILDACNTELEHPTTGQLRIIRTYYVNSVDFNISQPVAQAVDSPPSCLDAFRNIISTCVGASAGVGFWGGWVNYGVANFSISDTSYPRNALLSMSHTSRGTGTTVSSSPTDTRSLEPSAVPSRSSPTTSANPKSHVGTSGNSGFHTGVPTVTWGSSDPTRTNNPSGTFGHNRQSIPGSGVGISSNGASTYTGVIGPGRKSGALGSASGIPSNPASSNISSNLAHSHDGSATGTRLNGVPTGTGEHTDTSSGNGGDSTPLFSEHPSRASATTRLGHTFSGSERPLRANSGTEPSNTAFDTLTHPGTAAKTRSRSGASNSGSARNTHNGGSSHPLPSIGSSVPSRGSGSISLVGTHSGAGETSAPAVGSGALSTPVGSTVLNSNAGMRGGPAPHTSKDGAAPTQHQGDGPITPPTAIPTEHVDPKSPQASSEGVVIGGLLFSLSKSAKSISNDITVPATKTKFLDDIDDTEHELETLFKNMGGTLPPNTGGCGGGARRVRRGLGSLLGDVFNTVRCAINSVNTLKSHVDVPDPDFPTIEGDLSDIGDLAGDVDENDDDDDDNDNSTEENQKSTKDGETEERSTGEPSSRQHSTKDHSSNKPSSRVSSTLTPSSASASTTRSTASSGGSCGGCCPMDLPVLPTDGTPAVTAAPTDFDTLDRRRAAPGRLQRLVKRRPDAPLPKINNCNLQTPNGWAVTIPAYPGGYEFYTSDTLNQLGTLTAISRYYRSTSTGAPACTPTMTQINAVQWTFQQSGNGPGNDRVSVDHAYEIGFLKSFVESVVDKPSGISCQDTNSQFFDTGSCPANRLEPIFGSLPSFKNPDFVAMSQWLNGDAKGWVRSSQLPFLASGKRLQMMQVLGPDYDPNLGGANLPGNKVRASDSWQQAMKKIKNKMALAQILVGAALMINADNTIPAMQKTNNRIYKAFQTHDTYLSAHAGLPRANFGWAAQYKTYMNNWVNYRNGATRRLLPTLLTTVENDLNVANNNVKNKVQAELDPWTNLHRAMTNYYTGAGAGVSELDFTITWEWNTGNVKRDEIDYAIEKRQACQRPSGFGTASRFLSAEPAKTGDSEEPSTTTSKPAKSSSAVSESCTQDSDCKNHHCSSGDPFCAIMISKNRKRQNDSLPPGFCACENQDPAPSKTKNVPATTQPAVAGCTDGKYDNFDDCSAHCRQGMCQENAGQAQITCACN